MQELYERLLSNDIELDLKGHKLPSSTLERFKDLHLDFIRISAEHDLLKKHAAEDGLCSGVEMCQRCGRSFGYAVEDGKIVPGRLISDIGYLYDNPVTEVYPCRYQSLKPYGSTIEIKDAIVFRNVFRGYDEDRYDDGYVRYLESYAGRVKLAKKRASIDNVAYGQLDFGGFYVFVHPQKDSILIAGWEEDENGNDIVERDGHILRGEVEGGVWRWEATSRENVLPIDQEDTLEIECNSGKWEFTTYLTLDSWEYESQKIWAKLEKISE